MTLTGRRRNVSKVTMRRPDARAMAQLLAEQTETEEVEAAEFLGGEGEWLE